MPTPKSAGSIPIIIFERDGEIYNVLLPMATDEDLAANEQLLQSELAADSERLAAHAERLRGIKHLRQRLGAIFEANPGITVETACEIWKENYGAESPTHANT